MILKYDFTDPTGIKDGNYEIRTEHGRLLIASCPQWNHKDWRESLRKMKDLYAWIFEAATHANAETLFLPLLGEENEFTPAHRSVEALWDAACRSE